MDERLGKVFRIVSFGKSLIGLQMEVLKCHLDYSQDRTIAAENKASEAWAHLQSYMESDNKVAEVYLAHCCKIC